MTVAFVERKLFGGTCVNTGLHADQDARRERLCGASSRGAPRISASCSPAPSRIDMAKVKARADAVSANARAGVERVAARA